jgi:hypothetical protein
MENRFGEDFSSVRVHTDANAAESAQRLRARAYTFGQHVVFGKGQYGPATAAGKGLLAHELAHVLQQNSRKEDITPRESELLVEKSRGFSSPAADDRCEEEANQIAERVVAGWPQDETAFPTGSDRRFPRIRKPHSRSTGRIQRQTPELKYYEKAKVYSYTEEGKKPVWIEAFKVDFLKGSGFDVFMAAKAKGFSTFGALFIVAHASMESGWGKGNWADETHNLFSVMGGTDAKYRNPHGKLAKYADVSHGFDAYLALLAKTDRWPTTVEVKTGLYYQTVFEPDDVNKAFHQKGYYAKGGPAYNADPSSDYGDVLFDRMRWLAGPLIVLLGQIIATAPAGSANANLLPTYLTELQTAYSEVAARLAAHRKGTKK